MQTSMIRMKLAVSHHQMKQDRPNTKFSTFAELEDPQYAHYCSSAAQNGPNDQASRGYGSAQQRKQPTPMDSAAASVHPIRGDELCYDSSSSFEFHRRERSQHPCRRGYFPSRPIMPSKWNNAEKWILNKQNVQLIKVSNKASTQNRTVGDSPAKRADFTRPETGPGRFQFGSFRAEQIALVQVADAGIHGIRSAAMREMGTEMTPIPSQEPSRSPTPVSATTPLRSPASTLPSSPQREVPSLLQTQLSTCNAAGEDGEKELSKQEMKCQITKEIVALGVHLGKMNIVAWASKDERERNEAVDADEGRRIEYGNRAAAWEEAEKSKHEAWFKREEIRIQALESRQKAMSEEKTRRMEVRIEQMRAEDEAKMVKKARRKRAAAEARKARLHRKTADQAKYICQTGRIPSTFLSFCWSRLSFN